MGIGLFLAGAALFVYTGMSKAYYDTLEINRLEEQLRSSMNKMVTDIRRAGYSAAAINSVHTGVNSNEFMVTGTSDLTIPSTSCILFTYDSDSNGILPALNTTTADKRFGFRLSGTTLQSRPLTDSSFSCNGGSWQDLTDSNVVEVTNLTFTAANSTVAVSGTATLLIRNVNISLTGRLVSDPTITRTITQAVRIRNDKYQP
jgi:type II secretory pathway component PulJ